MRRLSKSSPSSTLSRLAHDAAETLAKCGIARVPGDGVVTVRSNGKGGRHLSGVIHCGRHLCPDCGPFNASRRREVLEKHAAEVAELGDHYHAVFTLRHHLGVRYKELRDAVKGTFRAMTQTRTWRDSALGFVRSDEITYGANGHHFHIHLLVTVEKGTDGDSVRDWVKDYWQTKAREFGRTAEWTDGWWSPVSAGDLEKVVRYGTKLADEGTPSQGLAHLVASEVLGGTAKKGSAPWDLPDLAYLEVWAGSKGQRWMSTSGIWRTPKIEAVESDEAASAEREKVGFPLATIDRAIWGLLPREVREWVCGLMDNFELTDEQFLDRISGMFGADLVRCEAVAEPPA
jgi:REP element-mobilizing transposase RayT